MNNDLIKRNIAIAYATSGLIRRIDGEDWTVTKEHYKKMVKETT